MSRWVEIDMLVEKAESVLDEHKTMWFDAVSVNNIYTAPSIDLVRCEECKWADNCSQNVAIRESYQMYEKLNFCSYGVRKES